MGGKRRQAVAAGRQERRPGGRSLRDRARECGGRSVCKDIDKQRQQVKERGRYGIGIGGGRNGMNDPDTVEEKVGWKG